MKKNLYLLLLILLIPLSTKAQSQNEQKIPQTQIAQAQAQTSTQAQVNAHDIQSEKEYVNETLGREDQLLRSQQWTISIALGILAFFLTLIAIGVTFFGIYLRNRSKISENKVDKKVAESEKVLEQAKVLLSETNAKIEEIENQAIKRLSNIENLEKSMEKSVEKFKKTPPEQATAEQKEEIIETAETLKQKPESTYTFYDWFLKAYAAQAENKFEDACAYYEQAVKLDSSITNHAAAYMNWGNVLASLTKSKKLSKDNSKELLKASFEKYYMAISLKPDYADAYYCWGNALADLAKQEKSKDLFEESFEKYEQATKFDPNYAYDFSNWRKALSDMCSLLGTTDYYNKAIKKLEEAENIREGISVYNLACADSLHNNKENTLYWLEKALVYNKKTNEYTRSQIEEDENLNNIKGDNRFKQLLDEYFPPNEG